MCRSLNMHIRRQRLEQLNSDLASGASRHHEAQTNLDACRKELRKAGEDVAAANNTIAGYTLRQKTRNKRRDDLSEELRQLNAKLDGIMAKTKVFRAMERDFESYQKSVRSVLQEAQRGALKHIHGPVSKLIRTEDAYATAIEIALGGAMQNVVVDTDMLVCTEEPVDDPDVAHYDSLSEIKLGHMFAEQLAAFMD